MTEIARDLVSRSEELCKLDSFVGDGDHGISIRRVVITTSSAFSKFVFQSEVVSVSFPSLAMANPINTEAKIGKGKAVINNLFRN